MTIKKNPYKNLDLKRVKKELVLNIEYLASREIEKIDDDVEIVTAAHGGPVPQFIATIEQKLDEYVVLAKDTIDLLKQITDIEEKVSEEVLFNIGRLEYFVDSIDLYFENRPPHSIRVRRHQITMTKSTKKGSYEYLVTKVAANIPTQIKSRSKLSKLMLQMRATIVQIKDQKEEETQIKGGSDLPAALAGLV